MGVLSFGFWSLCFWKMSFFVFVLDAIFCGTNFFIFQVTVWLVKSSWCDHCCSIHQVSWVSDRFIREFALWWFFVRKSCRHSTGSFFFLVLTIRYSFSFHKFERHRCLFGVENAFFSCYWYLGVLFAWFQFFSVESCHLMCLSVMRFFSLQVFHFWSECLTDIIFLMCSFLIIYSILLG